MMCRFADCTREKHARELCQAHYRQLQDGKDLSPLGNRSKATPCMIDGCNRESISLKLCRLHYRRSRSGTDMNLEVRKPTPGRWGSWYTDKSGYVYRRRTLFGKTESQAQHREVMKDHIGRDLLPHEEVHHLNAVRNDNRIENLELWTTSQPAGGRVKDKLAWAKEILEQYKDWEAA